MKNRMTVAVTATVPDLRPPLAGTLQTVSADSISGGAAFAELCESWRAWEASSSSEFLNWLLFTPHGRASATGTALLENWICFRDGRTELDDRAKAVLGDRLKLFRENPDMRIIIGGLAGQPGTVAHGMRIGLRRVLSIRNFLLAHGIDPGRIGIALRGPGWWVAERSGESVGPTSEASECRLQVIDPHWTLSRN
jgi:outer membrane protein OmpA-like peptidoglycan-associated protein